MFSSVIGAIVVGAMGSITITNDDDPDFTETYTISSGLFVVEKLLEAGTGFLIFYQGKLAL